ncbi:MAG: ATP-binding protein [Bacillota bacterium]|nr:ATP-binding protein [Bacillota bacterium]
MEHIGDVLKQQWQHLTKDNENTYHCALCHDTGYIFRGDVAVRCQCRKSEDLLRKQKKAGITPHLRHMTFENFDATLFSADQRGGNGLTYRDNVRLILNTAMDFVNDITEGHPVSGLLFQGYVGRGKTYMAASIANALVERDVNVRFVVVPDFLDDLRATFDSDSLGSESQLMEQVKTAPVLILDDLGAHNYTDWSVKTLFAILNYRINYELPIVVTTNLSMESMDELLGTRITSRLVEACRFFQMNETNDIRMVKRHRERMKVKGPYEED